MSQKEKLIQRLQAKPKDFTLDELESLLVCLGFENVTGGKSGGSRVKFMRGSTPVFLHRPHPRKELLACQVGQVLDTLKKEGLI